MSDNTITKYLKYLEESFLVEKSVRYDIRGKQYIGAQSKYYFQDIGIRNALLSFRQSDDGHIMENIVYNELRSRGYSVDVGNVIVRPQGEPRQTLEVDFVANKGGSRYYLQTAFDYATDKEQFGYERPLFGDESIFYPKNDCEDRSIFFSILVRDLVGLDVVLIHWPGHLATAVAFPEEVPGDYFTIDGRRFTVCDPTYIGAPVGETMPQFKNVNAELVKL